MTKDKKQELVELLESKLKTSNVLYLTDMSGMTVEQSNRFRRLAFNRNISVKVVKNTLLRKAMERSEKSFDSLYESLKGNTSLLISETGNVPAKLIKEFRKTTDKPILKAAFIDDAVYIGDNQIDVLDSLKSKEELVGDIILLLQSPTKTVISQLQSGGNKLAGIVKTLSERN